MYLVYLSVRFMARNVFGSQKHSGVYDVVNARDLNSNRMLSY